MFYVPKRGSIRSGNTMRAAIILTIAVLVPRCSLAQHQLQISKT